MSLVIKSLGTTAPEGAERLYRDALVTEGSLFLVDFSNRGTLDDFGIQSGDPVRDLAREAASDIGVTTTGLSSFEGINTLTPGRGVNGYEEDILFLNRGISFEGNLNQYLFENQPNSLAIVWFRIPETSSVPSTTYFNIISNDTGETGEWGGNIRSIQATGGGPTLSFGGSGIRGVDSSSDSILQQLAVEFRPGQTNRLFINGEYIKESTSVESFVSGVDRWGLGRINGSSAADTAVYRILIEDLEVSGRTADEVVLKDYNYVHALGEFEGIPKRPFVEEY